MKKQLLDKDYLTHINDSARKIQRYLNELTEEDFFVG